MSKREAHKNDVGTDSLRTEKTLGTNDRHPGVEPVFYESVRVDRRCVGGDDLGRAPRKTIGYEKDDGKKERLLDQSIRTRENNCDLSDRQRIRQNDRSDLYPIHRFTERFQKRDKAPARTP